MIFHIILSIVFLVFYCLLYRRRDTSLRFLDHAGNLTDTGRDREQTSNKSLQGLAVDLAVCVRERNDTDFVKRLRMVSTVLKNRCPGDPARGFDRETIGTRAQRRKSDSPMPVGRR